MAFILFPQRLCNIASKYRNVYERLNYVLLSFVHRVGLITLVCKFASASR